VNSSVNVWKILRDLLTALIIIVNIKTCLGQRAPKVLHRVGRVRELDDELGEVLVVDAHVRLQLLAHLLHEREQLQRFECGHGVGMALAIQRE
jgi:hypothetical protein